MGMGMGIGMGMAWPFSHDEDQDEEAGGFDDGGMFTLTPSDEYQPIESLDFLVDRGLSGFESVASVTLDAHPSARAASLSRFRPAPQALPPLPTFTSASSPSEFRFPREELDDGPEGTADDISAGQNQAQARMPPQAPTQPVQQSPGVLLARLLESLSVQLVRLNTEPWDLGVLSMTGSTADSGELNLTAAEALASEAHTFNPLLSILVSTEKLLDICKLLVPPETHSGGADEAPTATWVDAGSAGRSGSKRRVLSMHEASDGRGSQGAASLRRAWRPSSAVTSLPLPFSPACSSSSSSSSSTKRRESCPPLTSVPRLLTAGQTTITAAQLLTVVSCYLHVVTIYNDIFSHLLSKLAVPPPPLPPQPSPSTQHQMTDSGPVTGGTNVTPTPRQQHSHSYHTQQEVRPATHGRAPMVHSLVLAGYSVPLNSGLRMRLLVGVVEHQFELIEHALGLPGHYCVSTGRHGDIGGGQGLLAGPEAVTLLEAVMGGADGHGGAEGNANTGRDSIGVVASLRESLGKAQRVRRRGD